MHIHDEERDKPLTLLDWVAFVSIIAVFIVLVAGWVIVWG